MPTLVVTDRGGSEWMIEAEIGRSVMEIIRNAGFDEIVALCGGCCSCATCHIYVQSELSTALPPISDDENDLLDSSEHRSSNSRLSCQVIFADELDGLNVRIAPED